MRAVSTEAYQFASLPWRGRAYPVASTYAVVTLALETIAFASAQCVGYHGSFENGASGDGAYVCQLTSTAPTFAPTPPRRIEQIATSRLV